MTSQEKKAWLGRYRQLDQRIGQLLEEISVWRERAQKTTPSHDGLPQTQGQDSLPSAVDMIVQLEKETNQEIHKLARLKKEIQSAIQTVEEPSLRLLLEYRYIHSLTWDQVAQRMNYDVRQVYRLHGTALSKLLS